MAVADNPVVIHFNEFVVKQDFSLCMKQFPHQGSGETMVIKGRLDNPRLYNVNLYQTIILDYNGLSCCPHFPDAVAMCEEAVPKMVVTCNLCCKIFECIRELSFHFRRW